MSFVTSSKEVSHRIARRLVAPAILVALVQAILICQVKAANGDVDTGYGVNGRAVLPTPYNSANPQAAIQPDGKVVVAYNQLYNVVGGYAESYSLVVVRYLPNGTLDGSWPSVVLLTDSVYIFGQSQYIDRQPQRVRIRPDGKILVAYRTENPNGTTAVLLNTNGTIDTSFSQEGVNGKIFLGGVLDLVVLPDNRFVTMGSRLRSYSANGSFISQSNLVFPRGVPQDCRLAHLAATPDGRIVVSTLNRCQASPDYSLLTRYDADLSLDDTFCKFSTCSFPARVSSIEVATDGKIVAMAQGVVMRHLSNGSVDTSFGDEGRFTLSRSTLEFGASFKVDSGGRIVVKNRQPPSELWVIDENGSMAEEFTPALAENFGVQHIVVQEDGKVIVVYHFLSWRDLPQFEPASLVRFHYDDHRKAADLRFATTKITPATNVHRSDEIEYTIRVVNDGPDRAGHVTFENPLPDGTNFVSFEAPDDWVTYQRPHFGLGKVSCSGFSLEPGQIATFRLTVRIKAKTPRGSQILNTSTVKSLVPDAVPLNNVSIATVTYE